MSFESARREWDAEVEVEAERLMKLGVPPLDATIQAVQRIRQQRRQAAAQTAKVPYEQ